MFLANGAMAAARACAVGLAEHEHTAIRILDSCGDEPLCPEADATAHYLVSCTQSYSSDEKIFSTDTPAVAIAPPLLLRRVWLPAESRSIILALAQPALGPPLTILFGNFRN